jgi:hypothetical protein
MPIVCGGIGALCPPETLTVVAGDAADQAAGEGFGATGHARRVACPGCRRGSIRPSAGGTCTLGHNPALEPRRVVQQENWKRWGLAVIVNMARRQPPSPLVPAAIQSPKYGRCFPQSRRLLRTGRRCRYIPKANAQMTRAEVEGRRTINHVVYTPGLTIPIVPGTGPDARSVVRRLFTFGDGVSDEETYAAQIVKRSGRRVAAQISPCQDGGRIVSGGTTIRPLSANGRCRPTDAAIR